MDGDDGNDHYDDDDDDDDDDDSAKDGWMELDNDTEDRWMLILVMMVVRVVVTLVSATCASANSFPWESQEEEENGCEEDANKERDQENEGDLRLCLHRLRLVQICKPGVRVTVIRVIRVIKVIKVIRMMAML